MQICKSLAAMMVFFEFYSTHLFAVIAREPSYQPARKWEQIAGSVSILRSKKEWQKVDLEDVALMLKAMIADDRKDLKSAERLWYKALRITRADLSSIALKGWMGAKKKLNSELDVNQLARELWQRSIGDRSSFFIRRNGMKSAAELRKKMNHLMGFSKVDGQNWPSLRKRLDSLGRNNADPNFLKRAKIICSLPAAPREMSSWERRLSSIEREYWTAVLSRCFREPGEAITELERALGKLINKPRWAHLELAARGELIRLYRTNDRRQSAADGYIELINFWRSLDMSSRSLGLDPHETALRRINDTIWAARYRALIRDYKGAKSYVRESLKLIAKLKAKKGLSKHYVNRAVILEAEAYYVRAHRVAIEEKDLESAISSIQSGLELKALSGRWKNRFRWTLGFYEYLRGNYRNAAACWSELMAAASPKAQLEAKLLFWLARAHARLGESGKQKGMIEKLQQKYPLNFYTTVGVHLESTARQGIEPQLLFPKLSTLREKIANNIKKPIAGGDVAVFNQHFKRIEALLLVGLRDWGKLAIQHHYRRARKKYRLRSYDALFVRFAALLGEVGEYPRSISLLTGLQNNVENFWQKWPELVLIYFPKPYAAIFNEKARTNSLDKSLLYAIARQESAFDVRARSHADAFGLMQLIGPTAKRVAKEVGVSLSIKGEDLFRPRMNIALGSRLLANLQANYKGKESPIYAAYNAGKFVVDRWLVSRDNRDPLTWIELIPFGETRHYVMNVWRNLLIYQYLG